MDGPRPIDETLGTEVFRKTLAPVLDRVRTGNHTVLVRNESRDMDVAVLISPTMWHGLGLAQRDTDHLSSRPNGTGGYLTHEELAQRLAAEANELGGETVQMSAGEARCIAGLLTEFAVHRAGEPLGQLAGEWADRLGKRSATAK